MSCEVLRWSAVADSGGKVKRRVNVRALEKKKSFVFTA